MLKGLHLMHPIFDLEVGVRRVTGESPLVLFPVGVVPGANMAQLDSAADCGSPFGERWMKAR
jgi:hypothetical protein